VTDVVVGSSALLGDRKFPKTANLAAALALSFAICWPIPNLSFSVGFIFPVKNSRLNLSSFLKTGEFDLTWFGLVLK
jgi:hypothetical protein